MSNIQLLLYLLLHFLSFIFNQGNLISYCSTYLPNNQGCQQCISGYDLITTASQSSQSQASSNYCRSSCPDLNYLQSQYSNNQTMCLPTCQLSEIGDDLTRTCQQINQCPESYQFGQQFHTGVANTLLLYPNSNGTSPVTQIITSSQNDTRILVWDNKSGQLMAQLLGHNYNVIQMFMIPQANSNNSTQLLSFSYGGEIIIWDYEKGDVSQQITITQGQLTSSSNVNFDLNLIISFGFQGEFYVINYITQKSQEYIGHQSIVESVAFVNDNNFISTAKDQKVILWTINQPNNPLILTQFYATSLNCFNLQFSSVSYSLFILLGSSSAGSKQTISIGLLTNSNGQVISSVQNLQLINKTDNQFDLINYILDNTNNYLITFSTQEIIIYQITISSNTLNVQLLELNNQLTSSNSFLIQTCVLFSSEFIIQTTTKELFLYQYSAIVNTSQSHLQSESNNILQLERQSSTNQNVLFAFSQYDQILYAVQDYVLSINYQGRSINFIINNWQAPQISHQAPTYLNLGYGISSVSQIICDYSTDGSAYVYDFISEKLLNILTHPNNTPTHTIIPISIVVVQNINVCISYNDFSIVCFDPITSAVNFSYNNGVENYIYLRQDITNNFLVAAGQDILHILDLNLNQLHASVSQQNQFYITQYAFGGNLLYASTPNGYIVSYSYPSLTVALQQDFTAIVGTQKITGWSLDFSTYQVSVLIFDGGLILIIDKNFNLIKQVTSAVPVSLCGVQYPTIIACIDAVGKTMVWAIYTNYYISVIGLEFPIVSGALSLYGFALLQMNQGAFGSGILAVDMSQLTFSQTFSTVLSIQSIADEDVRMRVFASMQTGQIADYHFIYKPTQLITWQQTANPSDAISNILIFEQDYKIIILSSVITVYDYLNLKIFSIQQYHNQQVMGAAIDKTLKILITYNQDTSKNLFAWSYMSNTFNELVGHTKGVNGVILISNSTQVISYSNDGFIILWDYSKFTILQKLNLHTSTPVTNVFFTQITKNNNILNVIISQGNDQMVSIYDLAGQQIISLIQIKSPNSQMQIDDTTQRVFIYSSKTIYAYSYITGLQASTLLGFDGMISNFLIEGNYIIATATFIIQSYDRQSLQLLNSDKSTQQIYQIAVLNDLVGIISNLINDNIKLWNYQTGIMLQDLVNNYYPFPVNGIKADQDAQMFLVWNNQNQIFSFDPFSQALNKVGNYVILPIFQTYLIQNILIDYQSNIFFAYNQNQIIFQKYYSFLGINGQQRTVPQRSYNLFSYNLNNEKNIWQMSQNSISYGGKLQLQPKQSLMVGNVLIVRDYQAITSFNSQFVTASIVNLKNSQNIISDPSEINYVFVIDQTQNIIKLSVNQVNYSLKNVMTYNLKMGMSGNTLIRISQTLINQSYKHLFVSTIQGQVLVIDYSKDTIVANLTDHTGVIRGIIYNTVAHLLITSANDGAVNIYSYTPTAITTLGKVPLGGQIEQIQLDLLNQQLFVWINLQTKVLIISLKNPIGVKQFFLSPGDVFTQIKTSDAFDRLAVFNLFQINIYQKSTMVFLSKIRYPSSLQDIVDITFIQANVILVTALSSVSVYQLNGSLPATLINELPMSEGIIASYSFNTQNNQINLQGINDYYFFNYTFTLFLTSSQTSSSSSNYIVNPTQCYTIFQNSNDYFTMRTNLQKIDNSLQLFNSNQNMSLVLYNLLFTLLPNNQDPSVDIFFPTFQSVLSTPYQKDFLFQIQSNSASTSTQRINVNIESAYSEYSLQVLKLKHYQILKNWSGTQPLPILFNPNTQDFVFQDGLVQGNIQVPIDAPSFIFSDIDQLVVDQLTFDTTYFQAQPTNPLYFNSLINITSANLVTISQLVIQDCIFENQNFMILTNVQNVIIEDVIISNVQFKNSISQSNVIQFLFQFQNCQNVQLNNVTISNIQAPSLYTIFNIQGNLQTQINLLNANNLENTQILFYRQTYIQAVYEYKVLQDMLIIQNLNLNSISNTAVSLFDLQSFNATFNNFVAQAVQCNSCNGAVISAQATNINLINSVFSSNSAFLGGALYISQCSQNCIIQNCKLTDNKAINAGAIQFDNSQIVIENTEITNNSAYIGGGIRYIGVIPQQFQSSRLLQQSTNKIENNKAFVFGNNIGSYPRNLNVTFKPNNYTVQALSLNKSENNLGYVYEVDNFMSGGNFIFSIQLIDEEGQYVRIDQKNYPSIVQQELNSYQISCSGLDDKIQLVSETLVSLTKYDTTTSSFVFDKLVVNSKPLSSDTMFVTANTIQIPNSQNSSLFLTPSTQVQFNINFRACYIGEILIHSQAGSLDYCYQCPSGMYSLVDTMSTSLNDNCLPCPANALSCQKDTVILLNGFWRESNQTDLIVECVNQPLNCQGESKSSINYCKEGYIGPLCETCDLYGTSWGVKYSRVSAYQCDKCQQMESYYFLQGFAYVTVIGYIFYGIYQAYTISIMRVYGYYIRMMGAASIGTSDCDDFTSVYLKFIMHYLYISSIINIKQFQFPAVLDFLRIQVSSPIDSMRFVPDCYQSSMGFGLKPVFSRQVVSQILPIMYLFGMALVYFVLILAKKLKFSKNSITSGLVFVFIFLQPDVNSGLISVSSCRSIGSHNYITDDVSEKCFSEEHVTFLMAFCLPFFIIWAFIFPLALLKQMYRQRKNLSFASTRIKYGFLYQEYRLDSWYWEFLKMLCKLLITILNNYLSDYIILKSVSASLIIIMYLLLLIKKQPYVSKEFNLFDRLSHTILFIIMQISILIQASTIAFIVDLGIFAFYSIHYTYLCFLVLNVLKSQIVSLVISVVKIFPSLNTKLAFLKKYIDLSDNRMHVYKRWRVIWSSLFITKKLFQMNGEKINTIQQRKSQFSKQFIPYGSSRSIQITQSGNNILSELKLPYDSARALFQKKLKNIQEEKDEIQERCSIGKESINLDEDNAGIFLNYLMFVEIILSLYLIEFRMSQDIISIQSSNHNIRTRSQSASQSIMQYNFGDLKQPNSALKDSIDYKK